MFYGTVPTSVLTASVKLCKPCKPCKPCKSCKSLLFDLDVNNTACKIQTCKSSTISILHTLRGSASAMNPSCHRTTERPEQCAPQRVRLPAESQLLRHEMCRLLNQFAQACPALVVRMGYRKQGLCILTFCITGLIISSTFQN